MCVWMWNAFVFVGGGGGLVVWCAGIAGLVTYEDLSPNKTVWVLGTCKHRALDGGREGVTKGRKEGGMEQKQGGREGGREGRRERERCSTCRKCKFLPFPPPPHAAGMTCYP